MRITKKVVIGVIVGVIIVGGIGSYTIQKKNQKIYSSTEYSFSNDIGYFLTDKGLYYMQDEIGKYYDKETKKSVLLGVKEGDACYPFPGEVIVYDGKVYCNTADDNVTKKGYIKQTLYQCECDGSHKKKLYELPDGGLLSLFAYNGKLYYTFSYYCETNELGEAGGDRKCVNSLCTFDLNTKKTEILCEEKQTGELRNGGWDICPTDSRDKIYLKYRYYEGDQEDQEDEHYLEKFYRTKFLCYDKKTKKMTDCFTQMSDKSFVTGVGVYHGYLYCSRFRLEAEEEGLLFERYPEDGGEKETIMVCKGGGNISMYQHIAYSNNGKQDLWYDMSKDICYRQTGEEEYMIATMDGEGKQIALDVGDYSALKDGDTYTKSRFVPKIVSTEEFLSQFEPFEGGRARCVRYTPVKNKTGGKE